MLPIPTSCPLPSHRFGIEATESHVFNKKIVNGNDGISEIQTHKFVNQETYISNMHRSILVIVHSTFLKQFSNHSL